MKRSIRSWLVIPVAFVVLGPGCSEPPPGVVQPPSGGAPPIDSDSPGKSGVMKVGPKKTVLQRPTGAQVEE